MAEALIRKADRPGDLGWVVMAHGEIYAAEYGWGPSFETLVAQIVAEYAADHDPELEAGWIAELDGERVGCISASAARTRGRRSSGSCWSILTGAVTAWADGWSTPVWSSREPPGTSGWCCGRTIHWRRRGRFTWREGSS